MAMDWTELMMAQGPSQKAQPTYDNLSENELKKVLQQEAMAGMQERQKGADMQDFLAMQAAKQEAPIDLSGGFEIVKALGGDKSAGSNYQAPKDNSYEQLTSAMKNKAAIQAQVQDDRTNMLKTLLEAKKADKNAGVMERLLTNKDYDAFKVVNTDYEKPVKEMEDFNQNYGLMSDALATGDVYQMQQAMSGFARLSGEKGVLTDQDIARQIPDNLKMKVSSALAKLRSDPEYQAPPEVTQAVGKALERMRDNAEKKYMQQLDTKRKMYKVGPLSFPKHSEALYSQAVQLIPKKEPKPPSDEEQLKQIQEQLKQAKAVKP